MFKDSPYPLKWIQEVADFSREFYNPKNEPYREVLYINLNMILGSVVGSLLTLVGMFVYYFYKERKNRMEILRSLHM